MCMRHCDNCDTVAINFSGVLHIDFASEISIRNDNIINLSTPFMSSYCA